MHYGLSTLLLSGDDGIPRFSPNCTHLKASRQWLKKWLGFSDFETRSIQKKVYDFSPEEIDLFTSILRT